MRPLLTGGTIPSYPGLVDSLDYEAELGVIIGKDASHVSREDAFDYVFGYTVINDVSARNVQTRHKQWYFGKSMDGFTPMGPFIVTEDVVKRPPVLSIKSQVNGVLRQHSSTDRFIFDIPHVISELSSGMVLKAGTIYFHGNSGRSRYGNDTAQISHAGRRGKMRCGRDRHDHQCCGLREK